MSNNLKVMVVAVMLAVSGVASATKSGDQTCVGNSCNTTNNTLQGNAAIGNGNKQSHISGSNVVDSRINSPSHVENNNLNAQGQKQGQLQGQQQGQGQKQSVRNSGNSKNTNNVSSSNKVNSTNTNNVSSSNKVNSTNTNSTGDVSSTNTNTANGGAGGTATASNAGNNQSINIEADKRERVKIETTGVAPDVIANATAPCRVALGASAGWLGGAFGFSGSVLDEGCDAREDTRLLFNMGLKEEAVNRLCIKPEMAKALGSKCPAPAPAAEADVTKGN